MLETVWETGSSLLVNILGMSNKTTLVGKGTQHIGEYLTLDCPFSLKNCSCYLWSVLLIACLKKKKNLTRQWLLPHSPTVHHCIHLDNKAYLMKYVRRVLIQAQPK